MERFLSTEPRLRDRKTTRNEGSGALFIHHLLQCQCLYSVLPDNIMGVSNIEVSHSGGMCGVFEK